jgi:hypothetical protein
VVDVEGEEGGRVLGRLDALGDHGGVDPVREVHQ